MTRGGDEEQDDRPRRLDDREAEQQQQRQRDELDPARDDDGLGRRRRRLGSSGSWSSKSSSRRRGGGSSGSRSSSVLVLAHRPVAPEYGPCPTRPRASSSSATWSAASAAARCSRCCPGCVERYEPTFVVVNAENVAGGLGITPKIADELLGAGVDVITLGNHAYHRKEIYPYLDAQERIIRPANYLRSQPGRGWAIVERGGVRLGVVNLSGNLYLRAGRPGLRRDRRGARPSSRARSTTSWSTCTPRRRARRSAWAGTSTAA